MSLLTCFYTFMTALFSALIMVPFLRRWALDRGDLDQPDERKVHTQPTPRLGGIAIFLAFLFSAIIFVPINDTLRGILAGLLVVFGTGVMDDLGEVSPRHKFAGQIAATLVTIVVGNLYLTNLGNLFGFGEVILPAWLGIPFTLFAVVGMINAINLIDGLDGLAGGVSTISLAAFFLLGLIEGDPVLLLLSAAALGAILGFLKYNFYPARIFMGDAGSLVIGFLLGFMAVYVTQRPDSSISPMTPVLILGLPLVDTVWVMSKRVFNGMSPFIADRSHVHHKFLDLGFEHRFTVVIIYAISLLWACVGVLLRFAPEYLLLLLFLGSSLLSYFGLRHVLRNRERFPVLQRDAKASLRSSAVYLGIVRFIDRLIPAIKYLLGVYLLIAAWSVVVHNTLSWQVPFLLLLAGCFLWLRPLSKERQYLMLIAYVALGMASYEVWHADTVLFAGLTLKRFGDVLLGAATLIAVFKFQFRRNGDLFLSTSDYLALGVCVLFAIAIQQKAFQVELNGVLFRSVAALLAVRCIAYRRRIEQNQIIGACLIFMALTVVVGLLGQFTKF